MVPAMRSILCAILAALTVSGVAMAQAATPTRMGLGLDVGIPDGAVVSFIYQPIPLLRASVGGSYNLISPGARLGVTFTPWNLMFNPSLTLEGGFSLTGSNNSVLHSIIGSSGVAANTFKDLSDYYGNLHLGVEFGGAKLAGFFHVGMSYLHVTVHNFQQHLQEQNATDNGTLEASDPNLRGFVPSLKLGLLVFF